MIQSPTTVITPELTRTLIQHLSQSVTQQRLAKMETVLDLRTRHFTVALENIYQAHNGSAVVRSAECFGIQDLHIIENEHAYRVNPDIVMGAAKWVTMTRYQDDDNKNTTRCLTQLKEKGYKIVATSLREDSVSLHDLPIEQPLALCFGAEETGLSQQAHDLADAWLHIPMVGFTQSFNISVSAALCLQTLTHKLRHSDIHWQLSDEEKEAIKLQWLMRSTRHSDAIVRHLLGKMGFSTEGEAWEKWLKDMVPFFVSMRW
jgi:tRNA (guanosine-2'-O-)-methyltransferase